MISLACNLLGVEGMPRVLCSCILWASRDIDGGGGSWGRGKDINRHGLTLGSCDEQIPIWPRWAYLKTTTHHNTTTPQTSQRGVAWLTTSWDTESSLQTYNCSGGSESPPHGLGNSPQGLRFPICNMQGWSRLDLLWASFSSWHAMTLCRDSQSPSQTVGFLKCSIHSSHHCGSLARWPLCHCVVCDLWCFLFVPQDFRRLLKKEEKPLLMMFYAPCEWRFSFGPDIVQTVGRAAGGCGVGRLGAIHRSLT